MLQLHLSDQPFLLSAKVRLILETLRYVECPRSDPVPIKERLVHIAVSCCNKSLCMIVSTHTQLLWTATGVSLFISVFTNTLHKPMLTYLCCIRQPHLPLSYHFSWHTFYIITPTCTLFVKLEELHIATARKPLIHQNQPVARYQHRNHPCMS